MNPWILYFSLRQFSRAKFTVSERKTGDYCTNWFNLIEEEDAALKGDSDFNERIAVLTKFKLRQVNEDSKRRRFVLENFFHELDGGEHDRGSEIACNAWIISNKWNFDYSLVINGKKMRGDSQIASRKV
jgi:hypothetical protein